MVDPLRVQVLLDRLRSEIDALSRLAGRDVDADDDLLAAVKYRFVVAIETCLGLARHLVASDNLRAPRDYGDAFSVLGESELLPSDLARDLRDMARFRNLLVHEYVEVDDARVLTILRTRLNDLEAFRSAVAEAVSRHG